MLKEFFERVEYEGYTHNELEAAAGGGGGGIGGIFKGVKNALSNQWKSVKSGDFKQMSKDMWNTHNYLMDPGGLVVQNKDEGWAQAQAGGDLMGIGAVPAQAAQAAEKAASEQQAMIDKQNAAIEKERKKHQAVADERSNRMKGNQLLTGAETGNLGGGSLLGGV